MACEQERLWELQYLQYKTGIVTIKKSKKCNKKREIFSFFKKFICFICEIFAFQRTEKEPAASSHLRKSGPARLRRQAGHKGTPQTNSQAQAETYGISGRRRAPEDLSRLLRQRP